jgi:hypothetical protein
MWGCDTSFLLLFTFINMTIITQGMEGIKCETSANIYIKFSCMATMYLKKTSTSWNE